MRHCSSHPHSTHAFLQQIMVLRWLISRAVSLAPWDQGAALVCYWTPAVPSAILAQSRSPGGAGE